MKLDTLADSINRELEKDSSFEPTQIPPDLAEIKRLGSWLTLNMYNWRMNKVRKISVMRCKIKKPLMNIYAIEIYPEYDYDVPLLAIDFSCLKKKTFVYINLVPLFNNKDYFGKYTSPTIIGQMLSLGYMLVQIRLMDGYTLALQYLVIALFIVIIGEAND